MAQFKIKRLTYSFCLFLIIGFFLSSCCSVNVTEIKGNYISERKNIFYPYSEITFNDTAFFYTYRAGLQYKESQGRWSIENNYIVLNSYDYCKNDCLVVEEKQSQDKPYIQLKINLNGDKLPLPGWSIKINESKEYLHTDSEGKIYFEDNIQINNIAVFSIGLSQKNSKYIIKDKKANIFEIDLIMENQYKYFENEKMKLKARFLKFADYTNHVKYLKQ